MGALRLPISIHTLLAESDMLFDLRFLHPHGFLSTLSLRRATCDTLSALAPKQFLSTLSLRRATTDDRKRNEKVKFLSTLSLRRATHRTDAKSPQQGISIHALLAESDCYSLRHSASCRYFYPRSPCGERHVVACSSGARS